MRFLGLCPGTSCNQLVGCWRPFAGKLGRLPWETSGQSCKGLWGVLPNSARILERLLRGVAQSSWGILACSWEFKKVLAKSLRPQAWAAPIITQSSVVSNGDHLKNCPSDFRGIPGIFPGRSPENFPGGISRNMCGKVSCNFRVIPGHFAGISLDLSRNITTNGRLRRRRLTG